MQLDRIAIALRPRSAWQATDLGFALARRWWLSLWLAWSVPAALVYVPLIVLLPGDYLWVPAIVAWWLKPVWDSVPIYLASQRLFGEQLSLRQAWRQSARLLGWSMLPWLLWRRFSPTRSADLPLTLLERLGGAARRRRIAQLHPGMGRVAAWHTIACVHFEWVLIIGAFGLVRLMLPDEIPFDATAFMTDEDDRLSAYLYSLASFLAMSLVAPAYTMGGFMLYVCRRVELEGWDIEIRFRALAARLGRPTAGPGTVAGLLVASVLGLVLAVGFAPQAALAQSASAAEQAPSADSPRAIAQARISAVLDGEEFKRKVERTTIKARTPGDADEAAGDDDAPDWLLRLLAWLAKGGDSGAGEGLATLLRVVMWLLAAIVVVYVATRLRLLRPLRERMAAGELAPAPRPDVLFGLTLRPDSLPQDVVATALAQWRADCPRAALALLYRGALADLMRRHQVPFESHHTEGECARLVDRFAPGCATFFSELTLVWQRLAYAHLAPGEALFERLCLQWQETFGNHAA